jgi:hypothetical protein
VEAEIFDFDKQRKRQDLPDCVHLPAGVERLVHVYLLQEQARLLELDVRHVFQSQGDTWLSFNVTAAVRRPQSATQLRLLVHIRATAPGSHFDLALVVDPYDGRHVEDVQPLLLLSYSTPTVFF